MGGYYQDEELNLPSSDWIQYIHMVCIWSGIGFTSCMCTVCGLGWIDCMVYGCVRIISLRCFLKNEILMIMMWV